MTSSVLVDLLDSRSGCRRVLVAAVVFLVSKVSFCLLAFRFDFSCLGGGTGDFGWLSDDRVDGGVLLPGCCGVLLLTFVVDGFESWVDEKA